MWPRSITTRRVDKGVPSSSFTPTEGQVRSVTSLSDSSGSLEGTITVQNAPTTEKDSGSLRRSTSFMGSYLDSLYSKSLSTSPLDGGFRVGRGSSISDAPREIDQLSKAVSAIAALSSRAAKPPIPTLITLWGRVKAARGDGWRKTGPWCRSGRWWGWTRKRRTSTMDEEEEDVHLTPVSAR
jgi:hypothetical protein